MKIQLLVSAIALGLSTHYASAVNGLKIAITECLPDCLTYAVTWEGNSGGGNISCGPYEVDGFFSGTLITITAIRFDGTLPTTTLTKDITNITLGQNGVLKSVDGFDGSAWTKLGENGIVFTYCPHVPDGGISLGLTAPVLGLLCWLGARRKTA